MKSFVGLISVFALFFLSSCKDEKTLHEYDPEDIVVTVNTLNWVTTFQSKGFLVIENIKSGTIYAELRGGRLYTFKRASIIYGNSVNLHFVYSDDFENDGRWDVNSFFEITLGKEIVLDALTLPKKTDEEPCLSKATVNISFADVPSFEVATRSILHQGNSYTSNSLNVPPSYDSYPAGQKFYVCLQQGAEASFGFELIPNIQEHVISLKDLSSGMKRYSMPKNPDYSKIVKVKAFGIDGEYEVFNLGSRKESVFSGNTIDIFVPKDMPEMKSFSTIVSAVVKGEYKYSYYSPTSEVVTDYSFLEVGITLTHNIGEFPVLATESQKFDYFKLNIGISEKWSRWQFFALNPEIIYIPQFPKAVYDALPASFTDLLYDADNISVEVVIDSRFDNYDQATDHFLKAIPNPSINNNKFSTLKAFRVIQY